MSGRPVNPVLFLLDTAKVGVREFGREYGFSHSGMVGLTQGTFGRLSPRMVDSLKSMMRDKGYFDYGLVPIYGFGTIEGSYRAWQTTERKHRGWVFAVDPEHWARIKSLVTTATRSPADCYIYATTGTATRFAKELKVPPASVLRWATYQTQTMPRTIEYALRDVGFEHIDELRSLQDTWAAKWGK